MMKTLVDIQSAIIQWMKANTNITSMIPNTKGIEIRELEWQGDDFLFPNIRVHVSKVEPEMSNCDKYTFAMTVLVSSEKDSSLECNNIASVVLHQLHGKSINVVLPSTTVVSFVGIKGVQNGAMASKDEGNLWTSILTFSGGVH